jgi:hypothetical protein
VPSGIWAEDDYAKLPRYDRPTGEQPPALFRCHLYDREDERGPVCAGWAGCHDGEELLALRVAAMTGDITLETVDAIRDYVSPVPLFASGAEAATHGMKDILTPGDEARAAIRKIERRRTDLTEPK